MTNEDKQRIEKEAEVYTVSVESRGCSFWQGMYRGYVAGATAELERSEKILQEEREVVRELTSVLSEMYLADFGGNSRTIEEAMKRALKSSVYEQRIISIIKKGLNVWKQSKNF